MKSYHALIVFTLLILASVLASAGSYRKAERDIRLDVQQALARTLQQQPIKSIDADTICTYRNYIRHPEVRDTAYLAMNVRWQGNRRQTVMKAHAGCSAFLIWRLSDQRASGALAALAGLWMAGSLGYLHRRRSMPGRICLGGLSYNPVSSRFYAGCTEVRFTPMQQQLMEMFFQAPGQQLSKQEICDRLWPRKPDANETLYTLIRRIKPVISKCSKLQISCERGRSYRLEQQA